MYYQTPRLRGLGTFSGLTMGNNGSCPDGGSRNDDTQLGGGSVDVNEGQTDGCGQSG